MLMFRSLACAGTQSVDDRLDLPGKCGIPMFDSELVCLLSQGQTFARPPDSHQNRSSIQKTYRKPFWILQLAADSLLFREHCHRTVQIPSSPEDNCLVVEACLQITKVIHVVADSRLRFIKGHGTVEIASSLKDDSLVTKVSLHAIEVTQLEAGSHLLLKQCHGAVQVTSGPKDQCLVTKAH
jgi:hypothetical protein